jgi:hypothetical protein
LNYEKDNFFLGICFYFARGNSSPSQDLKELFCFTWLDALIAKRFEEFIRENKIKEKLNL